MRSDDSGPPLFTYAAMAAFLAFFGAQWKQFDLANFYAYPWRIADGQVWRLITCTFLHGSLLHILFNTALFVRFGTVIDNWLGPWFAMLFYAAIAASSTAAQLLVSRAPMIGASGVVYGFFGFLWVLSRRRDDAADAANKYLADTLLGWIAICFVINIFGGNIGNTAHIWGLLLGWLTGHAFVARKKWRLPLAAATIVLWALPILFTQRPVWDRTLAHLPYFRTCYPNHLSERYRDEIEHPANPPRPPGLFGIR